MKTFNKEQAKEVLNKLTWMHRNGTPLSTKQYRLLFVCKKIVEEKKDEKTTPKDN